MMSAALRRFALSASLLTVTAGSVTGAELRVFAASAPASSGDQIAQAIKAAVIGTEDHVEVINVPGAGGIVGLSQFATAADENSLLVTGSIMLDANLLNRTPVMLDRLSPVARLAVEPYVLVVAKDSPIRSPEDLRAALRAEPAKVTWAGGPAAGLDHVGTILLARAAGVGATDLNYVPFLSSAEALAATADEKVSAAFLAFGDAAADIASGRVRALAVAAPTRIEGLDAPTLAETGIAFEFQNWRGLVGKPDLGAARRKKLSDTAAGIFTTDGWQQIVARRKWQNAYLGPVAFAAFLAGEQTRTKEALLAAGLLKRSGN